MSMSAGMYLVVSVAILVTAGLIAWAVVLERRGHRARALRGVPWVVGMFLLMLGAVVSVGLMDSQDYLNSPWLWINAPLLVAVGVLAYLRPRWAGALLLVLAIALPAAGLAVANSTGDSDMVNGFTRGALMLYAIPGLVTGGLLLLAASSPESSGVTGRQPPATTATG